MNENAKFLRKIKQEHIGQTTSIARVEATLNQVADQNTAYYYLAGRFGPWLKNKS